MDVGMPVQQFAMCLNHRNHAGHQILAPEQACGFRLEARPGTGRKFAQQLAIKARVHAQTLRDGQDDLSMGDRRADVFGNVLRGQQRPLLVAGGTGEGDVLDQLDLGSARYLGEAFVCQLDDDPFLELVLSGSGGLDVIETRGLGPDTEYFQRRRSYQRLNVFPWAYEDSYFIERGTREGVVNETDNIVLAKQNSGYVAEGRFVTAPLSPPPGCEFRTFQFDVDTPRGTNICVNVLDAESNVIEKSVRAGSDLRLASVARLDFRFSTTDPKTTPKLHDYSLEFRRSSEAASTAR